MSEPTIEITVDKYNSLLADSRKLQCLLNAGIDNCEAYYYGCKEYYESWPEYDEEDTSDEEDISNEDE